MNYPLTLLDLFIAMKTRQTIHLVGHEKNRRHPVSILGIALEDGSGLSWNITVQGPGAPKQDIYFHENFRTNHHFEIAT